MYWSCCKMQLQNVTSNHQEICHWYLLQYGRNSSPVFSALDPGWRGMSLRSGLVIVLCSWAKHFLLRVPLYTCSRKRSCGGLAFQSLEFSPRILNLMFPYETTLTPPRVFSKCCYTENNTWARVDMEFFLRVFNSIAHEWAQRTSEMSSWTRKEKLHIYEQPCDIMFIFTDKKANFINEWK